MPSASLSPRRDFLKTAGAAILAAGLGRATARAQSQPGAAPSRWGVIGCGKRALRAHFPAIRALGGMEIAAVCDVMDEALRQGQAAAGGGAAPYRDYQRLLADPGIDTVVIATPDLLHCEMVVAALQAGKHVMCEKPMGLDIRQGRAMQAAAAASDRVVLYTTQLQYSPFYREMRRQIDAGRIGRPRHLMYRVYRGDWAANAWLYPDPKTGRKINWRLSQAASGGPLVEEGCHYFELLHWMAGGLPTSVQCVGDIAVYRDGRDTWDHAVTTMTYADGCIGMLDLCLFGPERLEMDVLGDAGSLHAQVDQHQLLLQARTPRARPEAIPLPPEVGHGVRGPRSGPETAVTLMYQDFVSCVRERKRPVTDSRQVFAACKTAWLGNLAGTEHRTVAWEALG